MPDTINGSRRPIQFWVAIVGVGGVSLTTVLLIVSVTLLAMSGTEGRAESDTLNNALLLDMGGLVGLSGTVGAYLFSRGAQGEPLQPPTIRTTTPEAGQGPTVTEMTGGTR